MGGKPRVVILGGGFGGVNVARYLAVWSKDNVEIVMVSASCTHTFTPWLYEIAAGKADDHVRQHKQALARSADIPLVCFKPRITCRQATVTGLDAVQGNIILDDGHTLHYDSLVIALGAESAYFGIVGLKEYSLALKTTADAVRIRQRLLELVTALRRHEKKIVNVVVGGAGPNGLELVAELAVMAQGLVKRGIIERGAITFTLVDGSDRVLAQMTPKASRIAEHRLRVLGVKIVLETKITAVTSSEVLVLALDGKQTLFSDCTIWAGGVQPAAVLNEFDLLKDARGRVLVGPTGEVAIHANIFALGDAALMMNPLTDKPVPQTAQGVESTAPLVAKNILRALKRIALVPYSGKKYWPYSLAVGGKYGLVIFGNVVIAGYLAFVVRRLVDLYYFLCLMPIGKAVKFWLNGVVRYNEND
jgi:NADH dehydrogenase